ncbi:tetratricopeptide repeat protein [Sphingobium sp.]|uniref:tetratricopeptide repeat protein n=1 Tax=Sphingobium sp. TaxID=1912891 RepID=UPI003BB4B1AB
MAPAGVGASVEPDSALHAYAQARMADSDGALAKAVDYYRAALKLDPARMEIARRSYVQGIESGDGALALRSAVMLEQAGQLPRDGTLLRLGDALARKDWADAKAMSVRMVGEENFAFLAPIVSSWISLGEGAYAPPVVDGKNRFSALAQRYVDEHIAYEALGRRDLTVAVPAIRRAIAAREDDAATMRLGFAAQLAAQGAKAEALMLLPVNDARFAVARAAIEKGKAQRLRALTPAQGYAVLLARMASDIASSDGGRVLSIRLARIATFADPQSAEARIVAAELLTDSGLPSAGAVEARMVPVDGWYGVLAQAELVDAMAAGGDRDGALTLARTLADAPGADPQRHVRLGQLLGERKDYAGAAAAFKAAQALYPEGKAPWPLLLFEGSALEQGKRWDEARVVLERAVAMAPNEPAILNYLGYMQVERRQNVAAALDLIKKASALKPQDAAITDSLGWAQFVTGDVTGAVPVLERAAASAPVDATINEHLGDALWTAGRRYEARYAWKAAAVFAQGDIAARLAAKTKQGLKPEYAAP